MDKRLQSVAEQICNELAAMALEAREAGLETLARLLDMARVEAEHQADAISQRVHAQA